MENIEINLSKDKKKEFLQLLESTTPTDKLALFFNLQEQRVLISNQFTSNFKKFLKDQNIEEYNKGCQSITTQLSSIGEEIIQIQESLSTTNPEWSKIISEVRENEKTKFILTAQNQVLKVEIDNSQQLTSNNPNEKPAAGSCFYEHIEKCESQINENRLKINDCIDTINEKLEILKYDLNEAFTGLTTDTSKENQCHDHHHDHNHK
ncbi:hypothetical protein ACTFIV_007181 [Dictyostelium citrinum]